MYIALVAEPLHLAGLARMAAVSQAMSHQYLNLQRSLGLNLRLGIHALVRTDGQNDWSWRSFVCVDDYVTGCVTDRPIVCSYPSTSWLNVGASLHRRFCLPELNDPAVAKSVYLANGYVPARTNVLYH